MSNEIVKFIKRNNKRIYKIYSSYKKAFALALDLKLMQNNIKYIQKDCILLFAVMKNESHRLPFFIEYYRKLGVGHFIFVDNGSTDNFNDIVSGQKDITTFYTNASYKDSNYGMDWCNSLLLRFGCGHWCLTCDPDEFFVYPYMESRDLRDLTGYLDSLKEDSFFATMIDMYSDTTVEESFYHPGENPLITCPFFDSTGYYRRYFNDYKNAFIQGGVRRRVFYSNDPKNAPALNKVPLIKWQRNFAYVESMHMATPLRLNQVCYKSKVTGALLHFKFFSQLQGKVQEEAIAKQHWDNSSEYQKYGKAIQERTVLYDPSISVRYTDWQTLAQLGLLNIGEWSV